MFSKVRSVFNANVCLRWQRFSAFLFAEKKGYSGYASRSSPTLSSRVDIGWVSVFAVKDDVGCTCNARFRSISVCVSCEEIERGFGESLNRFYLLLPTKF